MKLSIPPYQLRPMEDRDIHWVFRALSDPKVHQYYGVQCHTLDDIRDQMKWYKDLVSSETGLWFAVFNEDETPVGAIGLNDHQKLHRHAEIGYWLLPEFWGKGIMRKLLPRILEFGFTHWDLHRIEALVEPENAASSKLLRNAGFTFEGTRRECEIKDGEFISLETYSLLAREYQKR